MLQDELKTCIETLHDLRKQMPQELKTSLVKDLDTVIERLEACRDGTDVEAQIPTAVRIRTLGIISECLMTITNLAEIISRWSGPH